MREGKGGWEREEGRGHNEEGRERKGSEREE